MTYVLQLKEYSEHGDVDKIKYLVFGKNALMLCEKAMKKYPTVWMPMPKVWIHGSMSPDLITRDSARNPAPTTPKPMLIDRKAIVNLKRVGLPVFLNPI